MSLTIDGKTAVLIDGSNTFAACKALGFMIDFKKLKKMLEEQYDQLLRIYYYTAVFEDDQGYQSIRPVLDWMQYNGYCLRTKEAKSYRNAETGIRKIKGNMDIELTIDAMKLRDSIDTLVLFSGDGDFRSLVEALQDAGIYVVVISTKETSPSMVSDDLRRQADTFLDLVELKETIKK